MFYFKKFKINQQMSDDAQQFIKRQLLTYLGNKRKMLPIFEDLFKETKKQPISFLDGFSGSGVISRLAKTRPNVCELYSNDWEYYSYIMNSCFLQNVDEPTMININSNIDYLNSNKHVDDQDQKFYIYRNYSPLDDTNIREGERVYYTCENAKIIDRTRSRINRYPHHDRFYLLAPLIYKASIHNNTCGYFNSFYKHNGIGQFGGKNSNDLNRICGNIVLERPTFFNNERCRVNVLQNDIFDVLPNLYCDVAYFDPPYNKHPYGTYYFLLNEIAKWDTSKIVANNLRGQDENWKRSSFNSFVHAKDSFEDLINKTNAHKIWVSYNSNGLVSIEKMTSILEKYGSVEHREFYHPTYQKLLGQGKKFREKPVPQVKEKLFILNKKR